MHLSTRRTPEQRDGAMEHSSSQHREPLPTSSEQGRHIVWIIVVWGRVTIGLAMAAVGGIAFGHAWTHESAPAWWVGAITLLTGALLVLSGLYARSRPAGVSPEVVLPDEAATNEHEPLVPLLGALLVYKYQRISHRQLNDALEQQRKEGSKDHRRLGEILVATGAITPAQLQEALDFQTSCLRAKQQAQEHQLTV